MTAAALLVVLLDTALPKPVPPAYCGRNTHVPQVSKPAQPRWWTAMSCIHCQGQMRRSTAPFHVAHAGYRLSFDTVPAWICRQCGEVYFEEREVNAIQSAADSLDRRIRHLLMHV